MMARCYRTDHRYYYRYGGRGISVCQRWHDVHLFIADMGNRPEGKSLDRIDNDGNYEPSNCRWTTHSKQIQNSSTAKNITFNGETHCVTEWARRLGMKSITLSTRLRDGWPIERAFTEPIRYRSDFHA
jgi:hypothetical protein